MLNFITDHPILCGLLALAAFLLGIIVYGVWAFMRWLDEGDEAADAWCELVEKQHRAAMEREVREIARKAEVARIEREKARITAEIARRKKRKKANEPVRPLRTQLIALTNRELELAAQ